MLDNLFRLYKNNKLKKPLEDFTTETFTGILNYAPQLLNDFSILFLGLSPDNFTVRTQVKYSLLNDRDCIVDMVIEGENQICFIENKVHSMEGHRQLLRYSKVLDIFAQQQKITYLVYCTKNSEEKFHTSHRFKQIRWFEIAKFLESRSKNSPVEQDFLNFLKRKKMSQNLTITTRDTFVIENLFDTVALIQGHLERANPLFIQSFDNGQSKTNDGFSISQILKHKRLIFYFKDAVGKNDWSEIKYGFQLSSLTIYCGIWIGKKNTEYSSFKSYITATHHDFHIVENHKGFGIELSQPLSIYLNDKDGDDKILSWFRRAFEKLQTVLSDTRNLEWKIKVPQ